MGLNRADTSMEDCNYEGLWKTLSCKVSKQLNLVLARTSAVVEAVADPVASAGSVTAMMCRWIRWGWKSTNSKWWAMPLLPIQKSYKPIATHPPPPPPPHIKIGFVAA